VNVCKLINNFSCLHASCQPLIINYLNFFQTEFAASEPVIGLPEGILLQEFAQLRQLLDLFMILDWPTYFHDYISESSKYNLVTPQMAVILLEK
jgi:hypothetical protein